MKWIHNFGYFYKHSEMVKHCHGDCFVFIAHLFNVVLSLLIPSSVLSLVLVCLPRCKRVNTVQFPAGEVPGRAKLISTDRRIYNTDCPWVSMYMEMTRKRQGGLFGVMWIFYILFWVMVTGVYTFVKISNWKLQICVFYCMWILSLQKQKNAEKEVFPDHKSTEKHRCSG